ncbi:MAG: flagellar biosynthesis protein FlgB [Alphaproteobacteria bacterium]|nr:flagellar biosynthesis protein FlgB [Alphaproteobacteria bacterium]
MDLQNLSLYQMSEEKMRWLAQRQSVLSQNIANSDTPKYMPSDLQPLKFKEALEEVKGVRLTRTNEMHRTNGSADVKMVKTNPNHLSPLAEGHSKVKESRHPFETSIDKNGVILDEQFQKIDDTRQQHEQITALFKKNMSMLVTALGK